MREREKKAQILKIHRRPCLWFGELDICGPHIFPISNIPKIWAVKNEQMTHITGHAGSNKLGQKKPEGELGQTKTEQREREGKRAPAPDAGPRLWGRSGCRIVCWKEK